MEREGLKRADVYKRYYANYEKSLMNLEECILNVQLSTTQTSVNFALIRVWLEIEYLTTKIGVLRDEIKYNTFYAFCCDVNFREWAKKIRMYSDHIIRIFDDNQTDDELYLQPLGNIPHAYVNPSNRNADEDTFGFLADSMKPYGRSTSYKDMYALKTLSDELLPLLCKFRDACDSKQLRRAIEGRMEKFSDDLDAIYLMISSPSLDNLSSVYYCFDTVDDEIGKEVIIAKTGREIVTDEEHHDRHHPDAHELHHLRIGVVPAHLGARDELRVEEHGNGHKQREQRDMVPEKRDPRPEIDYGVVCAKVFRPEERLLTQLD